MQRQPSCHHHVALPAQRWGKCDKDYLAAFCAATCGRCTPVPPAQAPAGGANGAAAPAGPAAVQPATVPSQPVPGQLAPKAAAPQAEPGVAPGLVPPAKEAPAPKSAALECMDIPPPGKNSCAEQKASLLQQVVLAVRGRVQCCHVLLS